MSRALYGSMKTTKNTCTNALTRRGRNERCSNFRRTRANGKNQTVAQARVKQQQQQRGVKLTVLENFLNQKSNKINWEQMNEMIMQQTTKKLKKMEYGGVVGLVAGELFMYDGLECLKKRDFGYKEFVLLRTLGLKAYVLLACLEANCVKTPLEKCAVGRILADVNERFDGEDGDSCSFYSLFTKHSVCLKGDVGDVLMFLREVTNTIESIRIEKCDDEFIERTKNRYGENVNEQTFERAYVENASKAVEFVRGDGFDSEELILYVPNFDTAANDASDTVITNDDDDEPLFLFGKKSKKNKNKTSSSVVASAMKSVQTEGKSALSALTDLILTQAKKKKQQEPTFEEFASWGQSTSGEAMSIVLKVCLSLGSAESNENDCLTTIVVLPSELMKSALFFDKDPYVFANRKHFAVCSSEAELLAILNDANEDRKYTIARLRVEGHTQAAISDETILNICTTKAEGKRVKKLAKIALALDSR